MARDAKAAQRAALKRKKREKEVRELRARQKATVAEANPRRFVAGAADLPIEECVISKGWRERGLAHILLARKLPTGNLMVAGYYVDTLCVGLKDTALLPNVDPQEYSRNIKPNVFNDDVEFESCEPGLAKAVVEGAIAFGARFGFKPNKRWDETRRLLDGFPAAAAPAFGRDGKPWLVLRNGEKAPGAVAKLERSAGPGNYGVEEVIAE